MKDDRGKLLIEIIGEAASRISKELRDQYASIPWADIISMRNLLVHQYFGIDLDQVWDTVLLDLPMLHKDIQDILDDLDARSV
jgi:uncharacterized protein with HEPN domain